MKVAVDHELCGAHGRCYAVAESLFDLDDDGYSLPRVGDGGEVPTGQEAMAELAATSCPNSAILLS